MQNVDGEDRVIRFKEWGPLADITRTPKPEYLHRSDGTLSGEPFRIRTDSNGFIQSSNDFPNTGAMRKVVLLGDSFVESLFVQEQDRFPSVLERHLQASGQNFQCLNGGYSGATMLHSFNVFMNKVAPMSQYVEKVLI